MLPDRLVKNGLAQMGGDPLPKAIDEGRRMVRHTDDSRLGIPNLFSLRAGDVIDFRACHSFLTSMISDIQKRVRAIIGFGDGLAIEGRSSY